MTLTKSWIPHLYLLGANLIYGINYSVAKIAMPEFIKPYGFVTLRAFSAVLFFWTIAFGIKKATRELRLKDWIRLALCGLFGVAANQLLFFQGLEYTTAFSASVLMTSVPILVFLLSVFFLRKRISVFNGFGVLLGLSGALLMIYEGKINKSTATNETLGNLFVFLNATSYAVYLIIATPLLKKLPPILLLKWMFTFGLIFVLPFGWNQVEEISWSKFPIHVWWSVAFVLIFVSCFTYLLNISALSKLSPGVVSAYVYTQPIFASFIAIIFFGETLTVLKLVSTLMVFVGVYAVSFSKEKKLKFSLSVLKK